MPASGVLAEEVPAEWSSDLLKALYELVFSVTDREVAGVLVGSTGESSESGLPVVRAAIPATEGFLPGQAALFTHQTWAHVHHTMARHYSGLEAVGWYLSRPGRGTTLTEADAANHVRWFGRGDRILLAVDSRSHRAAIYTLTGQRLVRVTEGPVARRYSRPPKPGVPAAGLALLSVVGVALGLMAFVIAQAIGG